MRRMRRYAMLMVAAAVIAFGVVAGTADATVTGWGVNATSSTVTNTGCQITAHAHFTGNGGSTTNLNLQTRLVNITTGQQIGSITTFGPIAVPVGNVDYYQDSGPWTGAGVGQQYVSQSRIYRSGSGASTAWDQSAPRTIGPC